MRTEVSLTERILSHKGPTVWEKIIQLPVQKEVIPNSQYTAGVIRDESPYGKESAVTSQEFYRNDNYSKDRF